MRRTGIELHSAGLPIRNYSTHIPAVFNKTKLLKTFEKFNCFNNPRLIESLYLNQWGKNPERDGGTLQYARKPASPFKINTRATVLNVGTFTDSVRSTLDNLLGEDPTNCKHRGELLGKRFCGT